MGKYPLLQKNRRHMQCNLVRTDSLRELELYMMGREAGKLILLVVLLM